MGKKNVNLDGIDENFIISSFKKKDRLNNPSSDPIPLEPDKKENDTEELTREESKRKRNRVLYDESLFLVEAKISTREGKLVSIRQEYHDRITKIVRVIANDKVSIFSYIDNVLAHHFATYQNEIQDLYNKNDKELF